MPRYNRFKATSIHEVLPALRAIDFDGRELVDGKIPQRISDVLENNTLPNRFLYFTTYRASGADDAVPDFLKTIRFNYHLQPDWTGVTVLPDAPATGAGTVDYLYYYQRQNVASSMGTAGIIDVPTNWRNYTGAFRFFFERNELSEAQQLGILDGIEREILAGMGMSYTSTSTTARYIDFQNGSAGANAAITKAELISRGWTTVNVNQSEKFFNDINGTPRRWRVLHQA